MVSNNRVPTHPGEILLEEFLTPLGISQSALAEHLEIPVQRVNEIVRGRRGISPETAWLFSQALDTTPEFWITLQGNYDLVVRRPEKSVERLRRSRKTSGEQTEET